MFNNKTMHPLIIVITLLAGSVFCVPNQQQQQQQQQAATTTSNSSAPATSAISFQCPEQFGYYTDNRDCTKYYVCVFGEVLHESCTGGLRFSRELQTCDWPRNVECPQAAANGSATTQSQATFTGTTPFATTSSPTSTVSSISGGGGGSNQSNNRQQSHHKAPADATSGAGDAANNDEQNLKSSSSLVFADEGSDPQQPSFDETVSPVITPDGAIHLHDGSGGTYSLTPNHNRQPHGMQQQQQQQQQQDGENVDVFVKPLPLNNRARSQQHQAASNRQATSSKLQPATLPASHQQSHHHHRGNSMMQQQQQQQQTHNTMQHQQPQQHQHQQQHSSSNNNNNDNNNNNNDQFSNDQSSSNETPSNSESESGEEEGPNNQPDSISAQADREESESEQDAGASSEADEVNGGRSMAGSASASSAGAYIPPVMSPSQGAGFRNPAPNNRQLNLQQSSSLLSNGVGLTRQNSFKPINMATSSNSPPEVDNDNENANNFNSNQRSQSSALFSHSTVNDDNNQQEEESRSLMRPNIIRQTNQTNFNQQQQQRPSRMSNSNNNLQNNQFISSQNVNSENNNHNRLQATSRFMSTPDQSSLSNNVNFNDSSKLIRLQQSSQQFELPPSPGTSMDDAQPSEAPSGGPPYQKFPSPSARSQNVLFSQHPFGFVADSNNNNNPSFELHSHNGDGSSSQLDHSRAGGQQVDGGQSLGSSNNNNNLLQQQRRPRPPKRQQIPSGAARRQQATNGGLGARGPPANQQPVLLLGDGPDSTTMASIAGSSTGSSGGGNTQLGPTTSPANSGFLPSPHDHSPFTDPEVAGGGSGSGASPAGLLAGQRGGQSQSLSSMSSLPAFSQQMSRPIVALTTVNFQQQQQQQQQQHDSGPSNNGFGSQTAATFSTSPPAATTIGTGGRRFVEPTNRNLASSLNQGQRNAGQQLLASTESPPGSLITTNANANANANSNQPSPPALTTNQQQQHQPDQQQDPQLVANRYLSSAIDALEAGQPFGTVDYEFDILNDNSTERRLPSGVGGASGGAPPIQVQSNNQTSFNSNPATANKQRQPQQQQQQPSNFNQQVDDGESISATSGQQSGNGDQIGLSPRPHPNGAGPQPATNTRSSAGSVARSNGGQAANSRHQQQQQQQFNQIPFAPNLHQSHSTQQPPSSSSQQQPQPQPQQQQSSPPTKKPRPTNKKITVNHEQALANNRASIEPARRPEPLFTTPNALQTATKCDNRVCRLPDCKCGDTSTPGGLDPKVIPQVILLTFDDAVNDLNWEIYEELFTGRTNPNGCPILATFYVSHEWTDYGQVQTLYSRGHEMASHSVTHSFGEKFSKSQWFKEVNGQREILNMYGGVKMNDVRGMRAPFLQIGGNKMFEMLYDANFTYDSSMPIFENSPPMWPYTLDYQLNHECMITPCPTKSFPGVWEVGMTMWVDLRGGRCSMGDACSNPSDEDGVYEMLMKNFNRHYKSNRAPFGLFYHSAWFNTVHHRRGFLRFMGTVNSLSDVFFVTNWQMLQWMRSPTPLSEINTFEPWLCPAKNDRPPPCFHPSVCNVKSEHGTRFMKTCQPCPVNQQYPWVGSTGFKSKQASSSGSG